MIFNSHPCLRSLLAAFGLLTLLGAGFSQTPLPTTAQPGAIQMPQTKSRPIPPREIGIDPNKVVRWSLRDAIYSALEKNIEIQLERENVRLAEFDLQGARGVYDPSFTSTLSFSPQRTPNAFAFSGTQDKAVVTNTLIYNFGMVRSIEKTGATLQFNFDNNRTSGNRNLLTPQYSPQFGVTFTQPLMRNYKIDNNRRQIKIAKKQLDLSDAQFRQRAIDIISRVQQAYWDLAFAIKDEAIQREAVSLAETQLNNNQRQVEIGTLAPIDVVSAATSVESRRLQVINAMNQVAQAENTLKQLVVDNPDAEIWGAKIEPTDPFEIQQVPITLPEAVKLARENRPELRQLLLQKEINATNIEFFRNQAKPQVDFFSSYNAFGLGGNPVAVNNQVPLCNPVQINGQSTCVSVVPVSDGKGGYIPGIASSPYGTRNSVATDFVGGYPKALWNLFQNKYQNIRFGVSIQIPWKNKIVQANLGNAIEQGRRIDLQQRKQVQDIETQIRNDVQAIEFAKMRIEASRAARQLSEQQLLGEEKRFQAGMSTTYFVLERQNQVTIAKGSELRALTDYNKLVAQLQRDIATTLSSNNVEVKSEANPDKK